ncbi:uncharacterized protein LOC131330761 isoform X2 [Rhododendron vialii]|uniref:uncharacterized protein LOC131330761 isoform X2 n=1 Tax=Rhododendron vialii TaxID=182163 RepID=UPI00265EA11D|nr:uncharacterized protein LOC131330761 isoform X2 [Rhododendron vialii]
MFLMKRGSPQNTLSTRSSSQSTSENGMLPTDVLNVSSSGPSCHFNSAQARQLERSVNKTTLCREPEKAPGYSNIACNSTKVAPIMKSSVELMREITSLEVEIMHLERYLLSLYRTSFEQHLPTLLENKGAHLPKSTGPPFRVREDQSYYESEPTDLWKGGMASPHQTSFPRRLAGSDFLSPSPPPKASSDMEKANIGHRSLADHFGASCLDNAIMTPDRLSEGLVKCISAIYCKLANPSSTHTGFSASSTSSLSSSNTFSPRNLSGSWSPHFTGEATGNVPLEGFKEDTRQRATMIEVSKISLDDDSFNYAAIMLQKFRSLVKRLEKVDPGKMKREEKLAFWINIHNALFMHAYLAYGTHNHVRGTSILKAAYNVGGHYVNACIIQRSILGIRLHYSLPRLQTLLSPGKKFKMGSTKHVYAIEYPEPLVHFALCSGEFSDPSVRVYKAKSVFQDLKLAKEEFVQASIYIHKETKILLPKILDYFAKDMSLDVPGLLKVVNDCLSEVQQKAIIKCIKGRVDKYVLWLPQRSTFRYLIHRELVEGIISG